MSYRAFTIGKQLAFFFLLQIHGTLTLEDIVK